MGLTDFFLCLFYMHNGMASIKLEHLVVRRIRERIVIIVPCSSPRLEMLF
jgi:hypothetical protein